MKHSVNYWGDAQPTEALGLAQKLHRKIKGEVRFDDGARALYATDSSNYRQVPIGVVIPRDEEDVIETIALCRQFGAPITNRGAATSLAGQTCNIAVIMDFSKYMNRILEIVPEEKFAIVQPGCVLDDLRHAAGKFQLTFGPDPSTHAWCTLGGMIGNNSCGVHSALSQFYGEGARTSDQVIALDVLTYDGCQMRVGPTSDSAYAQLISGGGRQAEIYRQLRSLRDRYASDIRKEFPQLQRRVSGYNLPQLLPENGFNVGRALVGSESTCITLLQAKVHLVHSPPVRYLVVLGFPDVYTAGDHVPAIMKFEPTGLEGMDDILIDNMRERGLHVENLPMLPEGKGWLLVEIGGDSKEEAEEKSERLLSLAKTFDVKTSPKLLREKSEQEKIWQIRESSLGATAHRGPKKDAWEGWEDSAVPPEELGGYLRDLRKLLNKYGYGCTLYGHFAGGCVHTRIDFGLKTADGIKKYREFVHEAAHLVVSHHGTLSGEHGDGQSRAELLPIMYGDVVVRALGEFKAIWDPDNKMNPHKMVHAYRVDENLRYGTDYNPPQPETKFKFPSDYGSFPYAMERCVGVGKCRNHEGGTMCPSYMVTKEEMHSTRGRARLFWEMLNGQLAHEGWHSDAVRESLDLCLACKGCKSDCPVNVDMATYKAEFLSHHYHRRLRPRAAYSMGLIYWWARIASHIPRVANFFAHTRPLSDLMKWMGGITPHRPMPAFATQTFREWFGQRAQRNRDKPKVLLWPDTFTNFFRPEAGHAAVEVLEAAGFQVVIPNKMLCCGRPLYDFGMLKTAKSLLQQVLTNLREEIAAGTPVVGLEPSCVSVFRDELRTMFNMSEDARRLQATVFTLAEFLQKHARDFEIPELRRRAVVHGHCHHKAIMTMNCDKEVLNRIKLDYELLDSGCCGLAGSFGFEKEKYDVSVKCGERVLLPAVRGAPEDTLVITDGFSCHTQIEQLTNRKPMHIAQVVQLALREGTPPTKTKSLPVEETQVEDEEHQGFDRVHHKRKIPELVGAAVLAVAGVFAWVVHLFSRRKTRH